MKRQFFKAGIVAALHKPGTIRQPQPPDLELKKRVDEGQKKLDWLSEQTRQSELLTAADFAITINARDYD